MPVGADTFPLIHPVAGFRLGTASAGIKVAGRRDLVVMEITEGASLAAVFTQNAFCAAPVKVSKNHLQVLKGSDQNVRFLVTNTGNANAGTGQQGHNDALACCANLAQLGGVSPEQVLVFSTGVIGEPLPVNLITNALPQAVSALAENGWEDAGWGILTTDTRPKGATRQFEHEGQTITVSGLTKGSGMIKPNMATMLSYIATDASVAEPALQSLLQEAVEASFNRITVDGDTSTNDACVLVATAQAGNDEITDLSSGMGSALQQAVTELCVELAQAMVKDAEGATKFVTVQVEQGADSSECLKVAYAIGHSPLVKTALFASDANWGRILAAVGYAGLEALDVDQVQIFLGDVCIAEQGGRADSYTEEQGAAVMAQEEITIRIVLNRGQAAETVWTSDLSHDYVSINADYRS